MQIVNNRRIIDVNCFSNNKETFDLGYTSDAYSIQLNLLFPDEYKGQGFSYKIVFDKEDGSEVLTFPIVGSSGKYYALILPAVSRGTNGIGYKGHFQFFVLRGENNNTELVAASEKFPYIIKDGLPTNVDPAQPGSAIGWTELDEAVMKINSLDVDDLMYFRDIGTQEEDCFDNYRAQGTIYHASIHGRDTWFFMTSNNSTQFKFDFSGVEYRRYTNNHWESTWTGYATKSTVDAINTRLAAVEADIVDCSETIDIGTVARLSDLDLPIYCSEYAKFTFIPAENSNFRSELGLSASAYMVCELYYNNNIQTLKIYTSSSELIYIRKINSIAPTFTADDWSLTHYSGAQILNNSIPFSALNINLQQRIIRGENSIDKPNDLYSFDDDGIVNKKVTRGVRTEIDAGVFFSSAISIYLPEEIVIIGSGLLTTATSLSTIYIDNYSNNVTLGSSIQEAISNGDLTIYYRDEFILADLLMNSQNKLNQRLEELETSTINSRIYGVSGLYQTDPTLTRTDDAVDLDFVINSTTGEIASDFDDVFPWNKTRIVNTSAGKFVKFPEMWFRVGTDSSNRITDIAVSAKSHKEGNWYRVAPFMYSCYGGSVSDNKLKSVSGSSRQISKTLSDFRAYAAANGRGYYSLDLYHKTVLNFLWMIEFATRNTPSIMTGVINGSGTTGGTRMQFTGTTDSLTTPSGFELGREQMRYHYIEDFVGNCYEFLDGYYRANGAQADYVTANPAAFSDNIDGKTQVGYPIVSNGCISAFGWETGKPFLSLPLETKGTGHGVSYYCGAYNGADTAEGCLCCGATANINLNTRGLFYYWNIESSQYQYNLGTRLIKIL